MRVYVLHFETTAFMTRAFDQILDCERVASCMIEPEQGRLRFLAPVKVADALVHQVYMDGGLTWCSRHDLVSKPLGRSAPLRPTA